MRDNLTGSGRPVPLCCSCRFSRRCWSRVRQRTAVYRRVQSAVSKSMLDSLSSLVVDEVAAQNLESGAVYTLL